MSWSQPLALTCVDRLLYPYDHPSSDISAILSFSSSILCSAACGCTTPSPLAAELPSGPYPVPYLPTSFYPPDGPSSSRAPSTLAPFRRPGQLPTPEFDGLFITGMPTHVGHPLSTAMRCPGVVGWYVKMAMGVTWGRLPQTHPPHRPSVGRRYYQCGKREGVVIREQSRSRGKEGGILDVNDRSRKRG